MPRIKGIIRNVQYCSSAVDARGEPCLTVWIHDEPISKEFLGLHAIRVILERHRIIRCGTKLDEEFPDLGVVCDLLKGQMFKVHDKTAKRVDDVAKFSGVSNISNFHEFGGES